MKSLSAVLCGIMLCFLVVGCAALTTAPQLVSSGLTIYQSAKQLAGIAQSISQTTSEPTAACSQTLSEKMEGYAKWADTIAKAAAEIEAGLKKKE